MGKLTGESIDPSTAYPQQTFFFIFNLAGTNNIPGLHRILKSSKHLSWSPAEDLEGVGEDIWSREL
jgi:hypothetical protein